MEENEQPPIPDSAIPPEFVQSADEMPVYADGPPADYVPEPPAEYAVPPQQTLPMQAYQRKQRTSKNAASSPALATREAPHSLEVERAVLAVLLQGERAAAIHTIREKLTHPLAFYVRDHPLPSVP